MLVRSGRLDSICDGEVGSTDPGQFLELPAGSAHAIWAEGPCGFDVIGQRGLGLWMIVPDGHGGVRAAPIYDPEGPWSMEPPPGTPYTPIEDVTRLRGLSQTLF